MYNLSPKSVQECLIAQFRYNILKERAVELVSTLFSQGEFPGKSTDLFEDTDGLQYYFNEVTREYGGLVEERIPLVQLTTLCFIPFSMSFPEMEQQVDWQSLPTLGLAEVEDDMEEVIRILNLEPEQYVERLKGKEGIIVISDQGVVFLAKNRFLERDREFRKMNEILNYRVERGEIGRIV